MPKRSANRTIDGETARPDDRVRGIRSLRLRGPRAIPEEASTIEESFARLVRDRGDEPAIWSRGEDLELSFRQVDERVRHRHRLLNRVTGGGPESSVALGTGNGAAFFELFLALRSLDVPVVAVDGSLGDREQEELCRRLGVRWLLRSSGEGTEVGPGAVLAEIDVEARSAPEGTALVKITSGSTGNPEGVCLGEEALLAGIRQIADGMGIRPSDRVLVAIPLSHSYGFDNGVLSLAGVGTPLILEPQFYPGALLRALCEGRATFFPTVPPLVRFLGEVDWPDDLPLRTVICAGGPLPDEFADAFYRRSGRPVHQFYGSTETGGISFESDPLDPAARGTVGRPLPGVDVTLGDGGRVTVRSRANSGAVFGRDERLACRAIATGDVGEWTPEGRLRLVGRTADFVNVGGRKVSMRAVRESLLRLAGVDDAAVVAVDDPVRGERLVAFVVRSGNGAPLLEHLPSGLSSREIRVVDSLPYTSRGKLDRRRLRELARKGS